MLVEMIGFGWYCNDLLVVVLKVVLILVNVIFLFNLIVKLMIELVIVGICKVVLFNLFFNWGNIKLIVVVVFVEDGIMLVVVVCLCFDMKFFLCGWFINDWLLV